MNLLAYGGTVAIIGLFIVFLGLIILILAITVMQKIFDEFQENKKRAAEQQAPAPAPVAQAAVAEPEIEETYEDDPAIIAVIAAAIACMDPAGRAPVIRSVRRVNNWKRQARVEQLNRF